MPIAIAFMTLLLLTVPAAAQDARTFGTNSSIVHTISAHAFTPESAGGAAFLITTGSTLARACNGSSCELVAPVSLPAGAVLESFELDACDDNALGQVRAQFFRVPTRSTGVEEVGNV